MSANPAPITTAGQQSYQLPTRNREAGAIPPSYRTVC